MMKEQERELRRSRCVFNPVSGGLAPRLALGIAVACGAALFAAPAAMGQVFQGRATLLENARIVTGDGMVIDSGSILIQQGRVVAVGTEVAVPDNARRVDLSGHTITPGFIDAAGDLGMTSAVNAGGATHAVLDGLNPFAADDFADALQSGLTTIAIPATGGNGIQGQGIIVQLAGSRNGTTTEPIEGSQMLCIDLASRSGAIARLSLFDGLRRQFRGAVEYRKTVELYEDELLPDYLEAIKKRAEEKEEAEGSDDTGGDDSGANDAGDGNVPPTPPGRRGRGGRGGGGSGAADADQSATANDTGDTLQDDDLQVPPRPVRGGRGGRGNQPQQGNANNRSGNGNGDEIKKPQQPNRNPDADVLLKAIDHELPVAITADGSADILNALELADEFGLSIMIFGGAEAHTVATRLAEANVPVILRPNVFAEDLNEQIEALETAGVTWAIGTGNGPSRALLPTAQMIAGASDVVAIALITSRAARALRLGDNAGRITRGGSADLVVWTGNPLDPASRVRTVYINGRAAYQRPANEGDAP